MTLTKADLAEQIYQEVGSTKKQSARVVDSLFELIKQALEGGTDVLISGFGKFSVRQRQERQGRNPINGETMTLSSKKVVTFSCSGKLREKINRD